MGGVVRFLAVACGTVRNDRGTIKEQQRNDSGTVAFLSVIFERNDRGTTKER